MHNCPDCGVLHEEPVAEIVEDATAEAAVEIARIEAEKDITLARINGRRADDDLVMRCAALEAENAALRMAQLPAAVAKPEPEPEIVVVDAGTPVEPEAPEIIDGEEFAEAPEPEQAGKKEAPAEKKKKNVWF